MFRDYKIATFANLLRLGSEYIRIQSEKPTAYANTGEERKLSLIETRRSTSYSVNIGAIGPLILWNHVREMKESPLFDQTIAQRIDFTGKIEINASVFATRWGINLRPAIKLGT